MQDKNVIFKGLSDFLWRGHGVSFKLTVFLVGDNVEVGNSPCFVDVLKIFIILSFSFGFDYNFVDLVFAILELEFKDLA